ncbi:MAG TPA: hypothetical protein VN704_07940, partial [Verrucomicrobiae bacterium]|nr:hypothetical protein [Verrucomicrobiae bacterium]
PVSKFYRLSMIFYNICILICRLRLRGVSLLKIFPKVLIMQEIYRRYIMVIYRNTIDLISENRYNRVLYLLCNDC